MTEIIIAVIVSALGSSGLFGLITFLITRADNKKGAISKINDRIAVLERDNCRTQMLLLMSDYPDETGELMKVANHYFKDLNGNWYMTPIFKKWLKDHDIESPMWITENADDK